MPFWNFFFLEKRISKDKEHASSCQKKGYPWRSWRRRYQRAVRKQQQSFFLMCIRMIDIVFCCVSWFDFSSSFWQWRPLLYFLLAWICSFPWLRIILLLDDAARFELLLFHFASPDLSFCSLFLSARQILTAFIGEGVVRPMHFRNWPSTVYRLLCCSSSLFTRDTDRVFDPMNGFILLPCLRSSSFCTCTITPRAIIGLP